MSYFYRALLNCEMRSSRTGDIVRLTGANRNSTRASIVCSAVELGPEWTEYRQKMGYRAPPKLALISEASAKGYIANGAQEVSI